MNIAFKFYECHLGTRLPSPRRPCPAFPSTFPHFPRFPAFPPTPPLVRAQKSITYAPVLQESGHSHNASSSHVYATLCKNNCTISLKLTAAAAAFWEWPLPSAATPFLAPQAHWEKKYKKKIIINKIKEYQLTW